MYACIALLSHSSSVVAVGTKHSKMNGGVSGMSSVCRFGAGQACALHTEMHHSGKMSSVILLNSSFNISYFGHQLA